MFKNSFLAITIILFSTSVFPETALPCKITYFEPEDFSRNLFNLSFSCPKKISESVFKKTVNAHWETSLTIKINGENTELLSESIEREEEIFSQWNLQLIGYKTIPAGETSIILYDGEEHKLATSKVIVPDRSAAKDKQPIIERIEPTGGIAGDTITVTGSNFGNNIDELFIYFYKSESDESFTFAEKLLEKDQATSLSSSEGKDKIQFTIPHTLHGHVEFKGIRDEYLGKELRLKLMLRNRPSEMKSFRFFKPNWKNGVILFALCFLVFVFVLLMILFKSVNIFPSLLFDKFTNSYYLPRFQALLWTIILVFSYVYASLCKMVLLRESSLPDFNPSLIGLMVISYGGLFASRLSGRNAGSTKRIPTWRDLFITNGNADIAKLQLFLFTIITGFLYIYNLLGANIFQGLPDVPATLNGLLAASQSGFIGGQVGSQSIQVNYIYPEEISLGKNKNQVLEIYGLGFTDGMKVIIEGCKPVSSELKSTNELNVKIPEIKTAGCKNIILIPQNGNSIVIENALQINPV